MASWVEVDKALTENRHELVLSGEIYAARIAESGLDNRIFDLVTLNFLELSKCGLRAISEDVGRLTNLTNLVFHGNRLTALPDSIGQLQKLKYFDVSNNELTFVPDSLGSLEELQTLNVSCNKLSSFIDPSGLVQLHVLDLSHNCLEELPGGLAGSDLTVLATLLVHNNQLTSLPPDLSELPALKVLDISDNKLKEIPASLCNCGKLKEFRFGGNKLNDRRLAKMMGQCSVKAILDYLQIIYEKECKAASGTKLPHSGDRKEKKKHGAKGKDKDHERIPLNTIKVMHSDADNSVTVQTTASVMSVRPYIVCCIVRNLNFHKSRNMMKRFITLQTKLHAGICNRRQTATIATHDLDAIQAPLVFDARSPKDIQIIPLHEKNAKTAAALVAHLRQEADELRKEKKRNTFSGIHKYLDLLKDKEQYPCLVDASNRVISFPPITNSDITKVTSDTRNIFIEITSSQGLDVCKKVMEELLSCLLSMGIGQADPLPPVQKSTSGEHASAESADNAASDLVGEAVTERDTEVDEALDDLEITDQSSTALQVLVVQQVKVHDAHGVLKVIYPSRIDLQSESYRVVRDYD